MSCRHHHEPPPPACCSCAYACGCGCSSPCSCYPAPPPPSSASDHLLHAIAAHLLLGSAPPPPPPQPQPAAAAAAAHHAYPNPNPYQYHYQQQQQPKPQPPAAHHAHLYPQPPPPQQQQQQQQVNPPDHGQLLLHSLLRRVAALESTLPHCFPAPPVHQQPNPRRHRAAVEDDPPSPPPRRRARASAREQAARTIQAHFRRFLARRSRTLRQLKELAVLRSKVAALRESLSGRRRAGDPAAVSETAMGLLLHLDSIQGGDPMIREGKRAVSRELTRILEFVHKVLVKEHEELAMAGAVEADEYHEDCNGAFLANPPAMSKKKVSFCRNGKVTDLHCEAETEYVNDAEESSESSSSADADERNDTCSKKSANGKPGLAAPMPVHMESRRIAEERR